MTGPALVLAAALLIAFLGALVADWWESRTEWREWREDHAHDEPLSRLDSMDRGEDPWR